MISYETMIGKVEITETYLSKLIGHEVTSCFGVVGMAPSGGVQKVLSLISKKTDVKRGIVVKGDAESISIDLHIIVSYGININAIAKSIVNKVQYTVTGATGIKVKKVTVKVDGIKE